MRTVTVGVDDSEDELRMLAKWLREEDELRGRVTLLSRPVIPGQMGGTLDSIAVVITSGTASTLVTSVFAWLAHRRGAHKVTLSFHYKRDMPVAITCAGPDDAAAALTAIRAFLDGKDDQ